MVGQPQTGKGASRGEGEREGRHHLFLSGGLLSRPPYLRYVCNQRSGGIVERNGAGR